MTADQIKAGHTYATVGGQQYRVLSITAGLVESQPVDFPADCRMRAGRSVFAALCDRECDAAPESDQGEKVAQAQSQGASCGDGGECLPCPWCGMGDVMVGFEPVDSGEWWEVICGRCDIEGPGENTREAAIARWNRRTPPATDAVKGDLLAALHGLLNALPSATTHPAIKAARAAIARAEAGTPSNPRFRHKRTGDIYELLLIANEHAERTAQYPPTAVYRRLSDRTVWSRPVQDWGKDFEEVVGE